MNRSNVEGAVLIAWSILWPIGAWWLLDVGQGKTSTVLLCAAVLIATVWWTIAWACRPPRYSLIRVRWDDYSEAAQRAPAGLTGVGFGVQDAMVAHDAVIEWEGDDE